MLTFIVISCIALFALIVTAAGYLVLKFMAESRQVFALFGALILGVAPPCLLLFVFAMTGTTHFRCGNAQVEYATGHLMSGVAVTAPGLLYLNWRLFHYVANRLDVQSNDPSTALRAGAILGAAAAFLNMPAYLMLGQLQQLDRSPSEDWNELRLVLLLIVSGFCGGMWTGWHAYMSKHPQSKLWPSFSLKTLILITLATGAVLTIFAKQ